MRHPCSTLLLIVPLLALGCVVDADDETAPTAGAPAARPIDRTYVPPPPLPATVTNRFVVLLRDVDDVRAVADELVARHGGLRRHLYTETVRGFSVVSVPEANLDALRRDPRVVSVEDDVAGTPDFIQTNPGWALDRIDDPTGLDGTFELPYGGTGVHVYVIDSGVHGGQTEFAGRLDESVDVNGGDPFRDDTGHGTAVASIAVGATVGVARGAALHSVKVTSGGSTIEGSDMLAGLEWIGRHAKRPAVVNSSNHTPSAAVAAAMEALVAKGITVVKSAGNYGWEGCSDPTNQVAIAVGASDAYDVAAHFSSYGPCVPIHAPGVNVKIALPVSPSAGAWREPVATHTIGSGTSYSAPYVTGVAAALLQQNALLTPAGVRNTLTSRAWAGKLTGLRTGTPNRLVRANAIVAEIGATEIMLGEAPVGAYSWFSTFGPYDSTTYRWERSMNGGPYFTVGTGYTYTMNLTTTTGPFTMKLRQSTFSKYSSVPTVKTITVTAKSPLCTNMKLCD